MISEARTELVNDLKVAGINTSDLWPTDPFTIPGVIVTSPVAGTYVGNGQLRGEFEIFLDAIAVVRSSDDAMVALDALIETILTSTDFAFRGVDAISRINVQGKDYPGTVVHFAKQYRLFTPGA